MRQASRDQLEDRPRDGGGGRHQRAAGLSTSQAGFRRESWLSTSSSTPPSSRLSQPARVPTGAADLGRREHSPPAASKCGVDSNFGKITDRLAASEGMVEKLTGQVIDLRSKVLVALSTSSGQLRPGEGALLLEQIEAILKDQSHLQELTNQLTRENTHLRGQVKAAILNKSPSPHQRSAVLPKSSPTAGPSHDDIMEEFVRSVDECQGLSRQLSDKNKKLGGWFAILRPVEPSQVTDDLLNAREIVPGARIDGACPHYLGTATSSRGATNT